MPKLTIIAIRTNEPIMYKSFDFKNNYYKVEKIYFIFVRLPNCMLFTVRGFLTVLGSYA